MIEVGIRFALRLNGIFIIGEATLRQGLGIDHRNDAVDCHPRLDFRPVEGPYQGLGQSQARGFDHDVLRWIFAVQQLAHGGHEVIRHGAADAPVGEFDHVLVATAVNPAASQDFAIDADVAELVDDERDAAALGVLQHVADQRGLAGSEKAGDDCGWDLFCAHVA